MEGIESTGKAWKSTQIYGLAVICLFSGIIIGYLAHAYFHSSTGNPQSAENAAMDASKANIPSDQIKQSMDQQIELLLEQLRKSPDDPSLLAELGKVYYQKRQFAMAAMYYEDSVKIKPDAVVLVKLGGAYHFDGDDDKAISAWNRALNLDPKNPDALFNIGFIKLRSQGDAKAAIAAWQKLIKTNPNHPKRAQVEALIAEAKQQSEDSAAGIK